MVEIVSRPDDFTPVKEGLIFVVESDEESDFEVIIFDAQSEEEVGRKVIYGTTRAVVDIAPYVANMDVLMMPKKGVSALQTTPIAGYMIVVQTETDAVESDVVWVSNNLVKEAEGIHSIFPTEECREIAYGDDDDLKIKAPYAGPIAVEVIADTGDSCSYNIHSGSGEAVFHLSTRMFDESVERIVVDIYCDDEFLQSIDYEIVPRYPRSTRLMWLSAEGVLEHYTFAVEQSRKLVAKQKKSFVGTAGQTSSCNSAVQLKLGTKRCSERELEALATIITAPKVWIEQADGYLEAEVLDNEAVISRFSEVGELSITIEYGRKEVRL